MRSLAWLRRMVLGLLCVFCAVLFAGCGNSASDGAKKQAQTGNQAKTLIVGVMPDVDSIPFWVAREKGFFAAEGVTVELQLFKSAMERDAALQSGNLDGAISDMLAAAFAKDGGFSVKITSMTDGKYCLIAGKGTDAGAVTALHGKEIAVSKNTIIEFVTDQILKDAHMAETDIRKALIPQIPVRLEMLQNGQLTAATLPEPMAGIAVHQGCSLVTSSDALRLNPGVMLFTEQALQNKQGQIRAMYRAYNRAVGYLKTTDRAEYIDFVVARSGFPALAKTALQLPSYHEATLPRKEDWQVSMRWLKDKKLIKGDFTYDDVVSGACIP